MIRAKLTLVAPVLSVLASLMLLAGCADSAPKTVPPKESDLTTLGWMPLFNGKNLDGWTQFPAVSGAATPSAGASAATTSPAPQTSQSPAATAPLPTWSVLDGILRTSGSPVGYIATAAMYTDFELELEWRFDPARGAGNSGVLLRVQSPDKVWPKSLEAQLQSGSAGDIYKIGDFPAVTDPARTDGRHTTRMGECNELPLGQWNHYRIVMDGGWLSLWVNGKLQNVATGVQRVPGRIALQSEGAWIEFRDIRVKELMKAPTGK